MGGGGGEQGSIEQVEGLLRFTTHASDLLQWDHQIESVCHRLTNILQDQQQKGRPGANGVMA